MYVKELNRYILFTIQKVVQSIPYHFQEFKSITIFGEDCHERTLFLKTTVIYVGVFDYILKPIFINYMYKSIILFGYLNKKNAYYFRKQCHQKPRKLNDQQHQYS